MDDQGKTVRWLVFFSGKVQGVGFRYTVAAYARELGLTGRVQNLIDGRVQMEAQGTPGQLTELLISLKSTPPIRIDDFTVRELPLEDGETGFLICH